MEVCERCFEMRKPEDMYYNVCFQCTKTNNRRNNGGTKFFKEGRININNSGTR